MSEREPDPTRIPMDARIMLIILMTVLSCGGVLGYKLLTLILTDPQPGNQ